MTAQELEACYSLRHWGLFEGINLPLESSISRPRSAPPRISITRSAFTIQERVLSLPAMKLLRSSNAAYKTRFNG